MRKAILPKRWRPGQFYSLHEDKKSRWFTKLLVETSCADLLAIAVMPFCLRQPVSLSPWNLKAETDDILIRYTVRVTEVQQKYPQIKFKNLYSNKKTY